MLARDNGSIERDAGLRQLDVIATFRIERDLDPKLRGERFRVSAESEDNGLGGKVAASVAIATVPSASSERSRTSRFRKVPPCAMKCRAKASINRKGFAV